jgi:phosphatidylserine/phosphatidylglycerophosphate/cardiolipin synthase-like enzyme
MRPLVIALAVLAGGCTPSGGDTIGPEERAEDPTGSIRLILNPPGPERPMDNCDAEHCRALLELVDRAERSIDFAVYGMRNQTALLDAIKRAKARGVAIRGVVDRDHEGQNYYASTEQWIEAIGATRVKDDQRVDEAATRQALKEGSSYEPKCNAPEGFEGPVQCLAYDLGDRCLMAAHASIEPLEGGDSIMHDKFFVVDGRWVWTGSTNVSDSCAGGYNANLVTVIDSRRVATAYMRELDQMFEKGRFHRTKKSAGPLRVELGDAEIEVLFSPQDTPIRERVRPLIRNAKESIDIAIFFLTHKHIARDLIDAHLRGVKIRVIIDATGATNGYTKHELLREVGIPVKVEHWGGKMHMKSAVFDGQTVITGSMNWTTAGDDGNDENVVIIHSKTHAAQYEKFFEQIWADIPDTWLKGQPDPEGKSSSSACTDGIDNDFDGLADAEDPGCSDDPPPLPKMPPHWIKPKDRATCEW